MSRWIGRLDELLKEKCKGILTISHLNDYNQADSYETAKEKLKRIMVNDIQSGILQEEILKIS